MSCDGLCWSSVRCQLTFHHRIPAWQVRALYFSTQPPRIPVIGMFVPRGSVSARSELRVRRVRGWWGGSGGVPSVLVASSQPPPPFTKKYENPHTFQSSSPSKQVQSEQFLQFIFSLLVQVTQLVIQLIILVLARCGPTSRGNMSSRAFQPGGNLR